MLRLRHRQLPALLLVALAPGIWTVAARAQDSTSQPANADPRLLIAGIQPAADGDPRDAWISVAVEEVITWRLRRSAGVIAIPTTRAYQARRELQGPAAIPPDWPTVARALGARQLISGSCAGRAADVTLTLNFIDLTTTQEMPGSVQFSGRFYDVVDQATDHVLHQRRAEPVTTPADSPAHERPSESLTAIEYFARAKQADRKDDPREALRLIELSLRNDKHFRAAQHLLAQIEMRLRGYREAATHFRILANHARQAKDPLDRAVAELGQCAILQLEGASAAARTRAETALNLAFNNNDVYGQINAINVLVDCFISRQPVPDQPLDEEARNQFINENLTQAANWLSTLNDMLGTLDDRVGQLSATNRLALVYDRLGRIDDAINMHRRTITLAHELGSSRHEATAWLYMGECCRRVQRWPDALAALQKCLELASDDAKPSVRLVLGSVYAEMKLPNESLEQYELACDQLRDGDDLISQLTGARQLAHGYHELGRSADAIKTLREAIDLAHVLRSDEEPKLRQLLEKWRTEQP